jgi:GNAT superfamily N-acetyltransferase
VLLVLLGGGFAVDLALGGGRAHALAWSLAVVLVTGADALTVHAARSIRSLTVTDTAIRVGEESLDRAAVTGVDPRLTGQPPILGRLPGEGLPRGSTGLTLLLTDGGRIVVPTRHPDRLAAALQLSAPTPVVRRIEAGEYPVALDIAARAGALYRVAGYEFIDLPYPERELREAKAVFVIGEPPYGFVQLGECDGMAHIGGLAVVPGEMRKRAGTALLEAACAWARGEGYAAIVTTAYVEVPWNAPFYAARGFTVVDHLPPGLAELRDWERAAGLDSLGPRVAMRRDLGKLSAAPSE